MHEVLLYGFIWNFSATEFIRQIQEIEDGDLVVRVNSPGGDVFAGYGMIAKFKEFTGNKEVKVDGQAASMGFNFCLHADEVFAHETSSFIFHRAAMDPWREEHMSEAESKQLMAINKDFEKQFRSKCDVDKFEQITGHTVDDVFSMDQRLDVFLTAKQARQIGLVTKPLIKMNDTIKSQINTGMMSVAASFYGFEMPTASNTPISPNPNETKDKNKNSDTMNEAELKAKYPALYAQVKADGKTEGIAAGIETGVTTERERVRAWTAWETIDPAGVKAGIESGKEISLAESNEFMAKSASAGKITALNTEGNEIEGAEGEGGKPEGGNEKTPAVKFGEQILSYAKNEIK